MIWLTDKTGAVVASVMVAHVALLRTTNEGVAMDLSNGTAIPLKHALEEVRAALIAARDGAEPRLSLLRWSGVAQ